MSAKGPETFQVRGGEYQTPEYDTKVDVNVGGEKIKKNQSEQETLGIKTDEKINNLHIQISDEYTKASRLPKRTFKEWLRKYFLEGQALNATQAKALAELGPNPPWHKKLIVRYRRILGLAMPALFFHVIWWSLAIKHNFWQYFPDKYFLSITMLFGSLIAGMTSEGGGSVAFPVMTLAFSISPVIARDFSLGIQSCGMSAAAFTILWMRIQLEWNSIIFCSLGGMFGTVIGLEFIDPKLTPPQKKLGFVSVWFSFAFALFLLNRYHKRKTFKTIPQFKLWKAIVLLITGFAGGICTSISGSGLDICSFSILTLLFRVTEKTATPTSVILMAGNTCVGFFWRVAIQANVQIKVYEFMAVCVPIVVVGAPLGSVIGSHFHRQLLAALVYLTDTTALISGFILVKQTTVLTIVSVSIVVCGFLFFGAITYLGHRIMNKISLEEEDLKEKEVYNNQAAVDESAEGNNYWQIVTKL